MKTRKLCNLPQSVANSSELEYVTNKANISRQLSRFPYWTISDQLLLVINEMSYKLDNIIN